MSIVIKNQDKLSERHKELKKLGKVLITIERAGISPNTYYRALGGDETITADTLAIILVAQKTVIDETNKMLQNA